MTPSKTFIQTWYKWLRLPIPVKNLHLNSAKTPSYGIELDHLRSYVYSLGNGIIEGKNYNFGQLATEELKRLNKISLEIENSGITEAEQKELQNYISATRRLLEEIKLPFL